MKKKEECILRLKKAVERYLQHSQNIGNAPASSQALPVPKDVSMAGPADTFYESDHNDDLVSLNFNTQAVYILDLFCNPKLPYNDVNSPWKTLIDN